MLDFIEDYKYTAAQALLNQYVKLTSKGETISPTLQEQAELALKAMKYKYSLFSTCFLNEVYLSDHLTFQEFWCLTYLSYSRRMGENHD